MSQIDSSLKRCASRVSLLCRPPSRRVSVATASLPKSRASMDARQGSIGGKAVRRGRDRELYAQHGALARVAVEEDLAAEGFDAVLESD